MTIRDSQRRGWIPVLMYHSVVERVDGADPWRLKISLVDFEAQLAYLRKRGYTAIALEDVPSVLSGRASWRKPVAITFDDGYKDVYTHALPMLKKYGFIATVMLVSDRIGGRNDWDRGIVESAPLLSLAEIRELSAAGMRFGSHGATHACLAHLADTDARRELTESKAKLSQLLQSEITTVAYPYGQATDDVCRIAQEAGYVAAFGVDHGSKALHNFSRIDAAAYKGDTFLWRLKVSGIYDRLRQRRGLRIVNSLRRRMLPRSPRPTMPSAAASAI